MGIISSLVGGVFNLIGQGIANRQNKAINAANNDFNAKQAQLARDWQEEQYNKYSSPSALVRQYEEAGLNPALVAGVGQGATFSGSSASASSPIAMQNPFGNVGLEVASLIETVKNNKALRDLQREQSETEDAKQRNLDSDTNQKNIDNETRSEYNNARISEIKQDITESLNRISNDNKRVENEVNHVNGILSQINKSNEVSDSKIKEINANIRKLNSSASLDDQQKVYYAAQITYLWALSNNLYSEKGYTDTKKVEQEFVNNYLQQNGVYPRTEELTRYRQKYLILGSGIELDAPGPSR